MADVIFRQNAMQYATPVDPKHLVTKEFVEALVEGTLWNPVTAATTQALPAVTATEQTLTGVANGELAEIDGLTLAVGNRVLVKDQTDGSDNGIYVVTSLGSASEPFVLTRSEDANSTGEFRPGKTVYVLPGGAENGNRTFKLVTGDAVIVGTTDITFNLNEAVNYARTETVELLGDGSAVTFVVTHGLNTERLAPPAIRNRLTGNYEVFGFKPLTATTAQITCDPALADDAEYDVTLVGQSDL